MEEVYPVGNTHKAYYDDVLVYFEREGFDSEDSHILVVGGELIAWSVKDRYPESRVESIDVEERTLALQSSIAERLRSGEDPADISQQIESRELRNFGEEWGTTYSGIVKEIGKNVVEPDVSRVQDVETYQGDPDMIISNNVCDYAFGFVDAVERIDPDYVELYTILPADKITSDYNGRLEPDVNPDIDFWGSPGGKDDTVDIVLYSEES